MPSNNRPDIGEIETFHLDNGITLYVRKNSAAPVATVQAWAKTGSIHEGKDLGCGLSHFLEHMLFQGTARYSADDITNIVHENGGDINAYTSFAVTCYYIDILSEAAEKALDILADMIQNPLFKEKIFKTEKDVILRECAMGNDSPDRKIGEKLWQTVFAKHPVRHPIIGYKEKIESVNREMMTNYHKERYTPERIFFVVCGDVDGEKLAAHLQKITVDMQRGNLYDPPIIAEPEQKCMRHEIFYYDDPVARLVIGYRVPDVSSPDTPALDLLSAVLGQSKSSRFVKKLRDKAGLALNIDASCYASVFDGVFSVSAATSPEKMEDLKSAILKEITDVSKGILPSELNKVKKQMVTNLYRGLRSNSGIAHIIGNSVLTYGTPDYACKYIEDIEKVTEDEIIAVARKYLNINQASVIEMLPTELQKKKSSKKEENKNSYFPKKITLTDETPLIYINNNTSPLVDISLILPGGTICEGAELAGISKLTAKLLITGTKSFSEEEFAEYMDSHAISLSVSGGNNTFSIKMNCHIDSLEAAVTALTSMLSEPLFDRKTLEREKAIAIETLKSRKLSPMNAAEEMLLKTLYGSHPYASPNAGTEESINNLTVGKIQEFFSTRILNKQKLILGFGGNITEEDAVKYSEQITDSIPWSSNPVDNMPEPPSFPEKKCEKRILLPKEQTVVMLGLPGCSNTNDDRFAMDIIQTSLNGLSTRLFKSIRDDAGLAYYTGLYSSRGIHDGFIAFYAGTAPESAKKVIDLIEKEKTKLAQKGLTKHELKSSIARLKGEVSTQKLNPGTILFQCALSEFYGNGFMEPWTACDIYSKITQEELNRVIKKYFSTKNSITIIAGAE